MNTTLIIAEVFLMACGAFIGVGLLLGIAAAAAYFLGLLDE